MNCSLIIEESLREQWDRRQPLYIAFLDTKSAFDVVNHGSLMRKLYHMGVEGAPWLLIRSLHEGSESESARNSIHLKKSIAWSACGNGKKKKDAQ